MKILFVVNNLYAAGNGLSASARRTMEYLRRAGCEVRALSGRNPDPDGPQPDYVLEDYRMPVFDGLIRAHGYRFARSDGGTIRRAVAWADLVHLEEPFVLQIHTRRVAEEMGVPCTGTYHLHPENITASIHMDRLRPLNAALLLIWRDQVFDHCAAVQCPSRNSMERLKRFRFRAPLYLISNGVILDAEKTPPPAPAVRGEEEKGFRLLCIGRLAVEKDQPTLLRAMRYSRHADEIRLCFAGRGPTEKRCRRGAERLVRQGVLRYAPEFRFMNAAELAQRARESDLYIHCATVEVEGLSCLEALREGIVPVIAEGRLAATSQFALDERSVFPARNAKALAARIDYWLEHGRERESERLRYRGENENYDICRSAAALCDMFETAAGKNRSVTK